MMGGSRYGEEERAPVAAHPTHGCDDLGHHLMVPGWLHTSSRLVGCHMPGLQGELNVFYTSGTSVYCLPTLTWVHKAKVG